MNYSIAVVKLPQKETDWLCYVMPFLWTFRRHDYGTVLTHPELSRWHLGLSVRRSACTQDVSSISAYSDPALAGGRGKEEISTSPHKRFSILLYNRYTYYLLNPRLFILVLSSDSCLIPIPKPLKLFSVSASIPRFIPVISRYHLSTEGPWLLPDLYKEGRTRPSIILSNPVYSYIYSTWKSSFTGTNSLLPQ